MEIQDKCTNDCNIKKSEDIFLRKVHKNLGRILKSTVEINFICNHNWDTSWTKWNDLEDRDKVQNIPS